MPLEKLPGTLNQYIRILIQMKMDELGQKTTMWWKHLSKHFQIFASILFCSLLLYLGGYSKLITGDNTIHMHTTTISVAIKIRTSLLKISMHYSGVIMSTMASQITSFTFFYSAVYVGVNQRKLQSATSLAVVRGIHRWPMNSSQKGLVTRNMFPFWWRHHHI